MHFALGNPNLLCTRKPKCILHLETQTQIETQIQTQIETQIQTQFLGFLMQNAFGLPNAKCIWVS